MASSKHPSATNAKLDLPTITLDRTLTDLYHQYCPSLSHKRIGHIYCGTTCAADISLDFPRNRKYIYQDGSFNDPLHHEKSREEVQRTLAPKYLSLIPQRDSFITGKAPTIFFYSDRSPVGIEHDDREVERTLASLAESQRPEVIFAAGPADVASICKDHEIDALEVKLVVDAIADPGIVEGIEHMSKMLIDADILWYLNAKEALARSGLSTPATEVVDIEGHCPAAAECCDICFKSIEETVPGSCTGSRRDWVVAQTERVVSAVERKPLPFVFKNNQAFAGAGTYVVTKEAQREQLLEDLTQGGLLQRLLCCITPENRHLNPGSVLLMQMVQDPINDYGMTFFVGEDGSYVFLAASEQMIDQSTAAWIGSKISFPHQDELKRKFADVLDQTATFLHKKGYFGPAGADFLETKEGDLQIVDLNVRTTGSLLLPLMKTHFTSRGYHSASSLSVTVEKSRDEFCEHWRPELEAGQLCIVAWYEDLNAGKSYGDVVVGAEDDEGLTEMLAKVRESTEQVTF